LCAAPADPQRPPDRLVFGAGLYDVIDREAETLDLRFEYRWGWSLWVLQPWAGVEVTADGALYGLAGILADFAIGRRWVFTPGAGVGLYDEGNGKDLGHTVEFRTQIEFARRFAQDTRLAFALSHISNAGLDDRNPGTEVLTVYYSIPLGRKSGDHTKVPSP
jgi:hypothetical protein